MPQLRKNGKNRSAPCAGGAENDNERRERWTGKCFRVRGCDPRVTTQWSRGEGVFVRACAGGWLFLARTVSGSFSRLARTLALQTASPLWRVAFRRDGWTGLLAGQWLAFPFAISITIYFGLRERRRERWTSKKVLPCPADMTRRRPQREGGSPKVRGQSQSPIVARHRPPSFAHYKVVENR